MAGARSDEIDERLRRALEGFDDEPVPDRWPEELPLLQALVGDGPFPGSRVPTAWFEDVSVLFIQHQLGPLVPRLLAMRDHAMALERAWFVDVPYSTNPQVREFIGGFAGERLAAPFSDPLAEYTSAQLDRVEQAVKAIADALGSEDGRLLVVDDGAYFVRALHRLRDQPRILDVLRGRTHVVEQTTRGHRVLFSDAAGPRYRDLLEEIAAPVVSIARCRTKTEFEGPVIGAAVRRALVSRLTESGVRLTDLDRIGVIGFGTVGAAVFRRLREVLPEAVIDVIECDTSKHPRIEADGGRPLPRLPESGEYQLLIGCTGYASFDVEDRVCLAQRATLVSCSSGAVEFNRARFVEKAQELPDDEFRILSPEPGSGDIRATISFTDGRRVVDFLHAGFPVNFDGAMEHIPYRFIQVTHTLLFAAAVQVLGLAGPEPEWIGTEVDEWVLEQALGSLEGEG